MSKRSKLRNFLLTTLLFSSPAHAWNLGVHIQRFQSDRLDAFTGPRSDITSYVQSPSAQNFSWVPSLEASFPLPSEEVEPSWFLWIRAGIPQRKKTQGTPSQQSEFIKKTSLNTVNVGLLYQKTLDHWIGQAGVGMGRIWLHQSYETSGSSSQFTASAWSFETFLRGGYTFLEGRLISLIGVQYLATSQFKGNSGTGIYSDFNHGTLVQVLQGNSYEKMKWTSVNWIVSLTWRFSIERAPVLKGDDYESSPEF